MTNLIYFPNKLLRQKSTIVDKIDDSILKIVEDMQNVMYSNSGIGLAAIQIGIPKRIIITDCAKGDTDFKVLINPEILEKSQEMAVFKEGCLSVPGIWEDVERHNEILVRYTNLEGKKIELRTQGLLAETIQHEVEHLQGILFVDKIKSKLKRDIAIRKAKKYARN